MQYFVKMTNIIFLLLNILATNSLTVNQYFITQPQNTTSMAGSSVTLPCVVGSRQGVCQWTRDGLGLGVDIELVAHPRLTMSEQSCNLQISPLLPSDEGLYQCQVGAIPGVAPITSQSASLSVTAEPGQPHITQATLGDVMEVKMGEKVLLECQSLGGNPAAQIEWSDDSGNVIEDDVTKEVFLMEDGKAFRSISTLKVTPISDTNITCSVKSKVLPIPKTSVIIIKHLQKPKVNLSIDNPRIQAGDSFDITCNIEAYPEDVSYIWFINGKKLFKEDSSILRINKISKSFDMVAVTCKATNAVGSEESVITLKIEHAPLINEEPEDILAKPGESITFACLAEANPPPSYMWIKKNTREVVGFSSNLTVTASAIDDQFVCKVFSEGFNEIESRTANLQIIRRPKIQAVDEGQTGGELLLHCSVESVAKKTKITWLVNENPIDISDSSYETIYNDDGIFHHSFLVFKNEEKKMLEHGCFASNEVGNDYKIAQHTERKSNTIAISIAFILLLILIIFLSFALFSYQRQKCSSVDKMEKEKQLQILSTETQPCLDKSLMNRNFYLDESLISSSHSFDSCNTLNTTLARSFSLDESRMERRMGV